MDGSSRILKSISWAGSTHIYFSPDSRFIAYDLPSDPANDNRDVFILAVDGSRETAAVMHPANDQVAGWSQDGRRLLFISNRNGSPSLWSQAVEAGKPVGEPRLILPNFGANHYSYLGPAGSGLYYSALGGSTKVGVGRFDPASGNVSEVHEFTRGIQPDWSRDSKFLVYRAYSEEESDQTHLVVESVETGQHREFHPKLQYFNWPRWSPGGDSLLVQGTDGKGRQGVFQVNALTSDVQAVALAGAGESFAAPQWLPDGRGIVYLRRLDGGGKKALLRRDLRSGEEREIVSGTDLVDPSGSGLTFLPSPDGNRLAFVRADPASKRQSLNLISLDGKQSRELLQRPGIGLGGWTSDGKFLIYSQAGPPVSDAGGTPRPSVETWMLAVDEGQARKIELNEVGASQVTVSPNGKRIAFWIPNNTPEQIWVVEDVRSAVAEARK